MTSKPDFKVDIFKRQKLLNGTMADKQKVAYGLSNGAIFNNLERPLTCFSRSRHYLTLNISEMATDTATVVVEGEQETTSKLSNGTSFNDL